MTGLIDTDSAAALAQRGAEDAAATLRRLLLVAKQVQADLAATVQAVALDRAGIAALLDGLGVTYQWDGDGTRLRLMKPDGTYGDWSADLTGLQGDPGIVPTIEIGSVTSGSTAAAQLVPKPGVVNAYLLNLALQRGADGADGEDSTVPGPPGSFPNQAQSTLFGRPAGGGAGQPGALTVSQAKVMLAYVLADIGGLTDALAAKAALNSPTFLGTPAGPTAALGANTTQFATTGFVANAIANLISSAPGALDTLNELAAALGNDPNFATTVTNALAGKQPLDSDLTAISALTTQAFGRSVLEVANAGALRTLAGLVIGTDVQAYNAGLAAIAALSTTAFGRSVLDRADAGALRALAGLIIGTDVQAYNAGLAAIAALSTQAFGRSLLTAADAASAKALLGVNDGSYTFLGTLTTTSGTTQTLTGIASGYKRLVAHVKDVSHVNASGALQLALSTDVSNFSPATAISASIGGAANTIRGLVFIDLVSETMPKIISPMTSVSGGSTIYSTAAVDMTVGIIAALRFSNVGNYAFDAGSIDIYGVK